MRHECICGALVPNGIRVTCVDSHHWALLEEHTRRCSICGIQRELVTVLRAAASQRSWIEFIEVLLDTHKSAEHLRCQEEAPSRAANLMAENTRSRWAMLQSMAIRLQCEDTGDAGGNRC